MKLNRKYTKQQNNGKTPKRKYGEHHNNNTIVKRITIPVTELIKHEIKSNDQSVKKDNKCARI